MVFQVCPDRNGFVSGAAGTKWQYNDVFMLDAQLQQCIMGDV
jgi:hypothetical protein